MTPSPAADTVDGGQRALTIALFLAFVVMTLFITVRRAATTRPPPTSTPAAAR